MMNPKPQCGVPRQSAPRLFAARLTFQAGMLFLLSAVLSTGCVSKEQFQSEKVRGLNFQRLLAQEEKRADTLAAKLAQKEKEINELNTQLKKTKDKIAALESQNRTLTAELDALKEPNRRPQEQKSASDSPDRSQDPDATKNSPPSEPSLSDPFMSDEELLKILE